MVVPSPHPSTGLFSRFGACRFLVVLVSVAVVFGCADDASESGSPTTAEEPRAESLPTDVVVFAPVRTISVMDVVEDMSEEVANRFIGLADNVRKRYFSEAAAWFTDDFVGEAPGTAPVAERVPLPLGVVKEKHDVDGAEVTGVDGWLASLGALLQPLGSVEGVLFKVKGADFEPGSPPRGRVTFKVSVQGRDADGGMRSIVMWAWAEVVSRRNEWMLHRWQLDSLDVTTRPAPMFTDVSVPTGIAHKTGRFGENGQAAFYWNGGASGDFDGDGRWDLFVPTTDGCFLYRNRGDGQFEDVAAQWGLADDRGGTGAVFFDYDNDGDADLVVAHVGWEQRDGTLGGDSMRLYRNDGVRFADVTESSGLSGLHAAFSLTVGDFDGDGFSDVYVCSYNRMDAVYPESWHRAENGTANALYRNRGDGTFEDVAAAWGADDSRWTFAAAAADYDEDGDLDLYLANDYGDNAMLVNRGDGHFEDHGEAMGLLDTGNGMGAAWGDMDNDGHLDLYVANMSSTAGKRILKRLVASDEGGTGRTLVKLASGNSIFRFDPDDRGFDRVPAEAGGIGASWAWASHWLDIDLDGNQDVMVANGFITGETAADT